MALDCHDLRDGMSPHAQDRDADVQWKVLPRMIVYGSDLQSRVDEAKAAATSPENDITPYKKRKLGETLRSADPW